MKIIQLPVHFGSRDRVISAFREQKKIVSHLLLWQCWITFPAWVSCSSYLSDLGSCVRVTVIKQFSRQTFQNLITSSSALFRHNFGRGCSELNKCHFRRVTLPHANDLQTKMFDWNVVQFKIHFKKVWLNECFLPTVDLQRLSLMMGW